MKSGVLPAGLQSVALVALTMLAVWCFAGLDGPQGETFAIAQPTDDPRYVWDRVDRNTLPRTTTTAAPPERGWFDTKPQPDCDLIYNRLAKSGSTVMVGALLGFEGMNNFSKWGTDRGNGPFDGCDMYAVLRRPRWDKCTTAMWRTTTAEFWSNLTLADARSRHPKPVALYGHGLFHTPPPPPWLALPNPPHRQHRDLRYMNVARDPVTQYRSRYNYLRVKTAMVPFFRGLLNDSMNELGECGCHEEVRFVDCMRKGMRLGDRCPGRTSPLWTGDFLVNMLCNASNLTGGCFEQFDELSPDQHIEHSLHVIESGYSVIGLQEHVEETIEMVEFLFPQFFSGFTFYYKLLGVHNKTVANKAVAKRSDSELPVDVIAAIRAWPANRMDQIVYAAIVRHFWLAYNATATARAREINIGDTKREYLAKLAIDVNPDSRTPLGQQRLDRERKEAASKAKKKG